jgi:hypothetical protein
MSLQDRGCGCLVLFGIFVVIGLISRCNDKHSSAPKVSQPGTGFVSPAPSSVDRRLSMPVVSEPFGQLQSGNFSGRESALRMTNNLPTPAYVKVQDSHGSTRATIYLRAGESYELSVDPGRYRLKYVSGPGDEWRGTEHFFGSKSSFRAAELNYIGRNQRLSVTFYQTVSRHGSGGMQKIDEEDF